MVGLNDVFQELNPGCDFSLDNAVAAAKKSENDKEQCSSPCKTALLILRQSFPFVSCRPTL